MSNDNLPAVPPAGSNALTSTDALNHAWRVSEAFAKSELVPQHFRGKPHNVLLAVQIAQRASLDLMTVLQNLYVVHGRAGWSAQYLIAQANRSGVFRGVINWRETDKGNRSHEVEAFATLTETGDEVAFAVSMAMAEAEGWTKNQKYRTMPSLMLRYRSATLLVRLFCPEVLLGLPAADEVADVVAAARAPAPSQQEAAAAMGLPDVVEVEDLNMSPLDHARADLASWAVEDPREFSAVCGGVDPDTASLDQCNALLADRGR